MENKKQSFYDIIKKKDHVLIKKLLLDEIDKNIKNKINSDDDTKHIYIMAVYFNCRKDKIKYFSFSQKEELLKKIVYYMYDDIKRILYYDWKEELTIMQNLDTILLENDCLSVSLELIDID